MEWLHTLDNFEFVIVVLVTNALGVSLAVIFGDWVARKIQSHKERKSMAELRRKDVIK